MVVKIQPEAQQATAYAVEFDHGGRRVFGEGTPSFVFHVADEDHLEWMLQADDFSAAKAFIRGEFRVSGDLAAAIRWKRASSKHNLTYWLYTMAARLAPRRVETIFQTRKRSAWNIQFHYDRPHEFYRKFLDSRFVYSCGYFQNPAWSLEQAQHAKLDYICRKLDLHAGETFLDIGCGWGGLLIHASEYYDVKATGCTLSHSQYEFASSALADRGLEEKAAVREIDYRDLQGRYQKISSIGMFEHVGRRRLGAYFKKAYSLLEDDGLFLNSGITRPQPVSDDPQTFLLQRKVFPGAELPHLADVIREAENAGFEVLDIENLRTHYALTCRAWVQHLQENSEASLPLVGGETYRTWLLYLAASAISFEDGLSEMYQVLLTKAGRYPQPHLTREYIYR